MMLLGKNYSFDELPLGTLLHWQHTSNKEDQDVVVLTKIHYDGDLDVIVRGDTDPRNVWTIFRSEIQSGKVQLSLVEEC